VPSLIHGPIDGWPRGVSGIKQLTILFPSIFLVFKGSS
jgi:hypothetical protein